jgi:methionyl-tRNA formyltransferase
MKRSNKKMSSRPRLVFFGNERLATAVSTDAPTLRALVAAGYHVGAVVASHSQGVSRSRRQLEILDVAHAYHIPVILPARLSEIKTRLEHLRAEAGVLVAFGKIVPPDIIDLFPQGIINIHPSLLPKLRGSTPVETAILNGLEETGVSLMKLTAEMDAGPVYAQKKIALAGTETKTELAKRLLSEGSQLLIDNLEAILDSQIKPKVQDETEATFSRLLTKQDGQIDFSAETAEEIERKVRAFEGFPKVRADIFKREIVITKARVAAGESDGQLVIKCLEGYLEMLELTAPSGRTMTGADFIRGYKKG